MTPQERQLVEDLFDRLARLEQERRDPEAVGAIADGLQRAPNAAYALVQTVLVQDEALKRADARIQELETAVGGGGAREPQGGFLDSMRGALFGREQPPSQSQGRGSVPSVRSSGGGLWNSGQTVQPAAPYGGGPGAAAYAEPQVGRGGSFLGTAASAAAGVIAGSLLFDGIRSLMGGHGGSATAAPFQSPFGGDDRTAAGSAADSDLARQAGLDNVGNSPSSGQGLFGQPSNADDDNDVSQDGDDGFGDDFGGDDFGSSDA